MHRCKAYARAALVVVAGGLLALLTAVHETASSSPRDWDAPTRSTRLSPPNAIAMAMAAHEVSRPAAPAPAHCGEGWAADPHNPAVWRRAPHRPVADAKQATLASDKACTLQRKVSELWVQRWHVSVPPADDADLQQRWPGCFQAPARANASEADLRSLLTTAAWRAAVTALSAADGPLWLNAAHLALNPALRPLVYHVPVLITTVERNAAKLEQTLRHLGLVDGIAGAAVVLAIEGFSLPLLESITRQLSYAYAKLLFVPISQCYAHRPRRSDDDGKDFRINLSFVWAMHALMVRAGYPYVALLEDDMAPGPDFYLHHVALSAVPQADPTVVAVMASNAGLYYDCHGLLRAHLAGLPSPYDMAETNAVYFATEIMPWGAGYTLPIVLDVLQWYLQNELTGPHHRYDIIMNRVLGPHRASLFPLAWRIHGDPKHYSPLRRLLPAFRACDHATYRVVWPPDRTGTLRSNPTVPDPHPPANTYINVTLHGAILRAGRTVASGRQWHARLTGGAFVLGDVAWQSVGRTFSLALDPTAAYHRIAPPVLEGLEQLFHDQGPALPFNYLLCPNPPPSASPTAAILRGACWLQAAHLSALPAGRVCLRLPASRGDAVAPSCTLCLTLRDLLVYGVWRGTPVYASAFQPAPVQTSIQQCTSYAHMAAQKKLRNCICRCITYSAQNFLPSHLSATSARFAMRNLIFPSSPMLIWVCVCPRLRSFSRRVGAGLSLLRPRLPGALRPL
eukprot:EG_transcript_4144